MSGTKDFLTRNLVTGLGTKSSAWELLLQNQAAALPLQATQAAYQLANREAQVATQISNIQAQIAALQASPAPVSSGSGAS